ncbi:GNAT family N-acetyltransferase [Ramlibacter humi]|uniref:GNAT family N-acetyltransferase n=1 Tax=Ramlibacter humi TaxID=2530451 RepID=A0A4Z0CE26_9BURK|nr:GNAT family N-acetyltransferase [Ramlibacter humi]TFZ08800.1 GNAT family N-acetyltransferase [Ramlibacter humi]
MTVDVRSLELSTLAAVPPEELLERDGWLLAIDGGTVGRAHSAVPTRHDGAGIGAAEIEREYASRGRRAVFRVPMLPAFDALRSDLASLGYRAEQPTLTMAGTPAGLQSLPSPAEVELGSSPGEDWAQVFLGEGFDPVDGASRLGILKRGRQSVFAAVRDQGRVVAVGSAGLAHGWCGIHGMRTLPAWRGRGFAAAILSRLGDEAQARGIDRAFLQVEMRNTAQRLYGRAGFQPVWVYEYWRRA